MFHDGFNFRVHPALFSFICASKDFVPVNFKESFSLVEIGCGKGETLLVLASLYPESKFYGIDSNRENLNFSNKKAKELGLNNVQFFCVPYRDLNSIKLSSDFDYVVLSVSYSYLSDDEINAVKKLVNKTLKKGGIFYFNFHSVPGSASEGIFWKFIKELLPLTADENANVEKVYELLEIFTSRPTRYLFRNPELRAKLAKLLRDKKEKEFREELLRKALLGYFWPKYFFEIFDELTEEFGLQFIGRVDLELNDPEISLFPAHIPTVLRFSQDARRRESIVDFILNIGRHHDVWMREPSKNFELSTDFLDNEFFLIPRQKPENIRRVLLLPGGYRFSLTAPIYEPFYSKGEEPVRLSDHPAFESNKEAVKRAFYKVVSSGEFFICCDNKYLNQISRIKDELPERFKVSDVNGFLLENSLAKLERTFLVSDVTKGSAIVLTPLETVIFWFSFKEGKSKAVDLAYDYLQSVDKFIHIEGETKTAKDVYKEELEKTAEFLFKGRKAFNLQRLSIVNEV